MEPGFPVVEAVVQVGDVATSYLRCGRGPRVVLVALDPAERFRLLAALAPEHCVIAPEPPPAVGPAAGADLADWLRGVLDGLGLQDAALVLSGDAASLAPLVRAAGEHGVRLLQPAAGAGGTSADRRLTA